jgi:hypothetical protein
MREGTMSHVWAVVAVVGISVGWLSDPAQAGWKASIGDSGEFVELRHEGDGRTVVDLLPLHRSGDARYFSAGVGLEAREAEYPPFSLKIVFTAGGKPFLSGVAVAIQPSKGGAAVAISREQVDGPWLFVDLPTGSYDVTATYDDNAQTLTRIKVEAGRQKTVYLRWSEDRGIPASLPAE